MTEGGGGRVGEGVTVEAGVRVRVGLEDAWKMPCQALGWRAGPGAKHAGSP